MMSLRPFILIVDDQRSQVRLLEKVLQNEGFEVITAYDGVEGLRKTREEIPDLVVLDIIMPGLDGLNTLKLLRQSYNMPVIMLTTESEKETVCEALALGADDYVVKPFHARQLLARIRVKLKRAGVGVT